MNSQVANLLDVNGVSHSFGSKRVIDQISFTVGIGEFKVLLGPNGAGKSTLFPSSPDYMTQRKVVFRSREIALIRVPILPFVMWV